MTLINLNVTYLRQAGQLEEAAYELRRAATSIIAILDLLVLLKTQDKYQENNLGIDVDKWNSLNLTAFIEFLIEYAVYFIDRAAILYSAKSVKKGSHQQKSKDNITDFISSKLSITAVKLCIVATKSTIAWRNKTFMHRLRFGHQGKIKGEEDLNHYFSLQQIITSFAHKHLITNESQRDDSLEKLKDFFTFESDTPYANSFSRDAVYQLFVFKELLEQRSLTKRYPILNRLEMLQQLSLLISQPKYNKDEFIYLTLLLEIKDHLSITKPQPQERITQLINNLPILPKGIYTNETLIELFTRITSNSFNWITEFANLNTCLKDSIIAIKTDKMNEIYCQNRLDKAINYTKELLEIEEQFDSPHHFTPTQVAYTCFRLADTLQRGAKYVNAQLFVAEKIRDTQARQDKMDELKARQYQRNKDAKYFYIRANEYFNKSQQMYTLRHEYYQSIGDLYYLYDDFNDRYIHHAKAIQIMSSTISFAVEHEIHQRLKIYDQKEISK